MSKYYADELRNREDRIRHWKYVKKIKTGSGNRYFYSWDEYRAYLRDPNTEVNNAISTAKQEITKSRKTAQKYISKGRKKAETLTTSSNNSSNMTVNSIKNINNSRDDGIKERIKNVGKRASEKWEEGKEAVKETVEKGKQWVSDKIEERKERKEEKRKEREKKRKEELKKKQEELEKQREKLAKKYKYIKKVKIGDKYVYFYSQDEIDSWNKKEEYIKNEPSFMKDVQKSEVPYTSSEDAIQVNPKFNLNDWDSNYEYNCAECTAIYELRRRGYDVESNGESGIGPNKEKYNTDARYDLFYENPEIIRLKSTKNDADTVKMLNEQFSKMPPGSRGDISFSWKDGGGHSIVWEKDNKGNVHFIDSQVSGHGNKIEYSIDDIAIAIDNKTTYKRKAFNASDKTWYNQYDRVTNTRIVRTDNLELKPEIKNICQNTDKKHRAKPNTNNPWTLRPQDHYYTTRTMDEKEIVTEYSNLTY